MSIPPEMIGAICDMIRQYAGVFDSVNIDFSRPAEEVPTRSHIREFRPGPTLYLTLKFEKVVAPVEMPK